MRRSKKPSLRLLWSVVCCTLLVSAAPPPAPGNGPAAALSPASFAYGARLDPDGLYVRQSIELAHRLGLTWLSIPLDWAQVWPNPKADPDLGSLAQAMDLATQHGLQVILSITNAPDWALTPDGPEPQQTAGLVERLHGRFASLKAVELFPGANTRLGWGAAPDPAAYLALYRLVQARLAGAPEPPWLVGAGLTPLPAGHTAQDMDDLQFLRALYAQGAQEVMPIVSVHFTEVAGPPMTSPSGHEQRVMRHIEKVRDVMLRNGHENGVVWVTSFSWPSGTIALSDAMYADPLEQALWLHQAYNLLNAQLYIGVAIFDRLNPAGGSEAHTGHALILPNGNLHPALEKLAQLTTPDPSQVLPTRRGHTVKKIYSQKRLLKPNR